MTYIPDPLELLENAQERWMDEYIDERICVVCKKEVDYELICLHPLGLGPCVCEECAGVSCGDQEV